MTSNNSNSFGEMVKNLRITAHLSQQELGERVGYSDSGAAISILRIEKQGVVPRGDRIKALAEALGADPEEFSIAAESARENTEVDPFSARLQHLKTERSRRERLEKNLMFLAAAKQSSDNSFILPFYKVAGTVSSLPAETKTSIDQLTNPVDSKTTEADYRLWLATAGLASAIIEPKAEISSIDSFADSVAKGAAAAAISLSATVFSSAVLAGLGAVLKVGQPGARSLWSTGALAGIATAQGITPIVGDILGRSKRQREEISKTLDAAEAEIINAEPNVEALELLVPKTTELFQEISTFGTRALTRWSRQIGDEGAQWSNLTDAQKESFISLKNVAAAHFAAATISFQDISTFKGEDLKVSIKTAEQVLDQAAEIVSSNV